MTASSVCPAQLVIEVQRRRIGNEASRRYSYTVVVSAQGEKLTTEIYFSSAHLDAHLSGWRDALTVVGYKVPALYWAIPETTQARSDMSWSISRGASSLGEELGPGDVVTDESDLAHHPA